MARRFKRNRNKNFIKKKKSRSSYNVLSEHNYFHDRKKKNCRWPEDDVNCTENITNYYDECDSTLDWYLDISSSDDEEGIEDMPLSYLLKIELEKDLIKKCKNKNFSNDLKSSYEGQTCDESINMLNISNYSNNIISENHVINDGKQSKIVQIVPLTNNATIIQNRNITNESQTKLFGQSYKELNKNKKAKIDLDDSNEQTLYLSLLETNDPMFEKKVHSSYNNVIKTSPNNVCPPLKWIHLIYLAIKNSATENVTCIDIQQFVRYWFPYYNNRSYIRFINFLLDRLNYFYEEYFYCNAFPITITKDKTWTINNVYINTLEDSLMTVVENNEDEIKSAMTNPGIYINTLYEEWAKLF